jgi:hypothetical protein
MPANLLQKVHTAARRFPTGERSTLEATSFAEFGHLICRVFYRANLSGVVDTKEAFA